MTTDPIINDLEKKIIKQLEYYFGDINLARDKFLKGQIKENDGWVSLDTMLTFKRLKELTEDKTIILNALKHSELLELSEDKEKIRRMTDKPLPDYDDERKEYLKDLTVYAKGFPLNEINIDNMTIFFEKYGQIQHIQIRKNKKDGQLKNSVFTVFKEIESVKKFLEEEETKYLDEVLIKYSKESYFKHKSEERKEKKAAVSKENVTEEEKNNLEMEAHLKTITKCAVLKLQGITKDTTFEDVKEYFGADCPISYVAYNKGDKEMCIRFSEENAAKFALEKFEKDGKVLYNDDLLDAKILENEEEIDYWKELFKNKKNNKRGKGNYQKRNRGKFGGGPKNKRRKVYENDD